MTHKITRPTKYIFLFFVPYHNKDHVSRFLNTYDITKNGVGRFPDTFHAMILPFDKTF